MVSGCHTVTVYDVIKVSQSHMVTHDDTRMSQMSHSVYDVIRMSQHWAAALVSCWADVDHPLRPLLIQQAQTQLQWRHQAQRAPEVREGEGGGEGEGDDIFTVQECKECEEWQWSVERRADWEGHQAGCHQARLGTFSHLSVLIIVSFLTSSHWHSDGQIMKSFYQVSL